MNEKNSFIEQKSGQERKLGFVPSADDLAKSDFSYNFCVFLV